MFVNKRGAFNPFRISNGEKESALNEATRKFFSAQVQGRRLVRKKAPEADLRLHYKKIFEIALATSLALIFIALQLARQFSLTAAPVENVDIKIEVADIPQTQQFRRPPPPPRPSIPIPTEAESVPEDLTIATTEIDLTNVPAPPPPPVDDEMPVFVAYDEPPQIIGGMAALQKHLEYPKVARVSGIEGIVFVKVLVGADGRTERTEILKAKPLDMGFEESAIEALEKVEWEPAKQRDRKIRVWVSIPVQFKLVSS